MHGEDGANGIRVVVGTGSGTGDEMPGGVGEVLCEGPVLDVREPPHCACPTR